MIKANKDKVEISGWLCGNWEEAEEQQMNIFDVAKCRKMSLNVAKCRKMSQNVIATMRYNVSGKETGKTFIQLLISVLILLIKK